MSDAVTFSLFVVLMFAVPWNIYAAVWVHSIAWAEPRDPLLTLLSRLVTILSIATLIMGIASLNTVLDIVADVSLPAVLRAVVLTATAVVLAYANFLVIAYIRSVVERARLERD